MRCRCGFSAASWRSATSYTTAGCLDDIDTATADVERARLMLVGHSLGGHVALAYAARTRCRGLVALDGPAAFGLGVPDDDIRSQPEPHRSFLDEVNRQDVAGLIDQLSTPALFVLCHGNQWWTDDQTAARQHLADYVAERGHQVRWVEAEHNFAYHPVPTGQPITDFLTARATP